MLSYRKTTVKKIVQVAREGFLLFYVRLAFSTTMAFEVGYSVFLLVSLLGKSESFYF